MKEIPLTQNKVAIVDDEDYEWLMQWKWRAKKDGRTYYAVRTIWSKRRDLSMHRLIMGEPEGMEVDHKDGDGLHNWRKNLRVCTHADNLKNKRGKVGGSGYKGVSFDKRDGIYLARIRVGNKYVHLGSFKDPAKAALAYDKAARFYHGEYAKTNF